MSQSRRSRNHQSVVWPYDRVPNAFYRSVGERIAEVRRERGLTQMQAAELARLNRVVLARAETGAENLSPITLSKLALALQVRPEVFLAGLDADPAVLDDRSGRGRGSRTPGSV